VGNTTAFLTVSTAPAPAPAASIAEAAPAKPDAARPTHHPTSPALGTAKNGVDFRFFLFFFLITAFCLAAGADLACARLAGSGGLLAILT